MRLGGIYALEGAMYTSDQYHQPVLEAFCAFVRESTVGKQFNNELPFDIEAAVNIIGRRHPGGGFVDLSTANIPGADLGHEIVTSPT